MLNTCIIIPCYNESSRIEKKLFIDFLETHHNITLCFVNDGSTDNTLQVLNEINMNNPDKTFVVNLERNSGKANAVQAGIKFALSFDKFSMVGYWDADLSTPLSEIPRMVEFLSSNPNIMGVIGSRIKRMGAVIKRESSRHILGRIFMTFANIILKFPVYDSQCGAKLFKVELAKNIFLEKFITNWLFDVELLARCRNKYGIENCSKMIVEFPLTEWKDIKGSKLKLKDYIIVPLDLLKIYFYYNNKNLFV